MSQPASPPNASHGATPPGWYTDPSGQVLWWDGRQWLPKPPKSRTGLIIAVTIGAVILLMCGVGAIAAAFTTRPKVDRPPAQLASVAQSPSSETVATGHLVVYTVTSGSGRANSVTYSTNSSGESAQASEARLPFTAQVRVARGFGSLIVVAQNGGSGRITCTISVDGKVVRTNTSTGQYAVVECSYALPLDD